MDDVIGSCPMCMHRGDFERKKLENSHAVPRFMFLRTHKNNSAALQNKLISLSDDANEKIDTNQSQGNEHILCITCEAKLNQEIETPTSKWMTKIGEKRAVQIESILIARFISSIWWRAILSQNDLYKNITATKDIVHIIMEESLNPEQTLHKTSVRVRKFRFISEPDIDANAIYINSNSSLEKEKIKNRISFNLIANGLSFEIFYPKLSKIKEHKLKCLSKSKSGHFLEIHEFAKDSQLIGHGAVQLQKLKRGAISPPMRKVMKAKQEFNMS